MGYRSRSRTYVLIEFPDFKVTYAFHYFQYIYIYIRYLLFIGLAILYSNFK